MDSRDGLPADVTRVLQMYADGLQALMASDLIGIYVSGSLALGDYRADRSDIDLLTIHRNRLTSAELEEIGALHEALAPSMPPVSRGLEVSYAPLELVGLYGEPSLPQYSDGILQQSGNDVNPVLWHSVRTRGITIAGPPPDAVIPPVNRDVLAMNMVYNLGFLCGRMPGYVATGLELATFGILSLCRVLYTMETGEIESKSGAGRWIMEQARAPDGRIIGRALRLHQTGEIDDPDGLLQEAVPFSYRMRALILNGKPSYPA